MIFAVSGWSLYNLPILVAGVRNLRSCKLKVTDRKFGKNSLPVFSLVVPVRDEEKIAGRLIDSLSKLDYPEDSESLYVLARKINDFMPKHMYNLTEEGLTRIGKKFKDSKIALLGWAFINNSDDTRDTPSQPYFNMVKKEGARVLIHDPYVFEYASLKISQDIEECIKAADAIVIFTGHKQYSDLKAGTIKKLSGHKHPVIIDGRNVIDPDSFIKEGFVYKGIGRGDMNLHDIINR